MFSVGEVLKCDWFAVQLLVKNPFHNISNGRKQRILSSITYFERTTLKFILLLFHHILSPVRRHVSKWPIIRKRGHYVGIHASGFKDFILKPECLRAVVDCGFEHPSEVQHECIPQAVLGMDIVCQAKSGMGKTAVFVLATLHQLNPTAFPAGENQVSVLVLCHTRELAFQIAH